ncbi:MAG: hypothetical protein QOJ63_1740 [Solirubrobacteraceae bacterium]|jgi:hypothetical protein|nr:hypothetical protein [Solirubrobacteraceae bacterium]
MSPALKPASSNAGSTIVTWCLEEIRVRGAGVWDGIARPVTGLFAPFAIARE